MFCWCFLNTVEQQIICQDLQAQIRHLREICRVLQKFAHDTGRDAAASRDSVVPVAGTSSSAAAHQAPPPPGPRLDDASPVVDDREDDGEEDDDYGDDGDDYYSSHGHSGSEFADPNEEDDYSNVEVCFQFVLYLDWSVLHHNNFIFLLVLLLKCCHKFYIIYIYVRGFIFFYKKNFLHIS